MAKVGSLTHENESYEKCPMSGYVLLLKKIKVMRNVQMSGYVLLLKKMKIMRNFQCTVFTVTQRKWKF